MKSRVFLMFAVISTFHKIAFAGLAIFSPPSQDVTPGAIVTMDLTLTAQTPSLMSTGFDTADVIINSDAPFNWTYGPEFVCPSCGPDRDPNSPGLGIKPYDLYVGGATPVAGGYGQSVLLGTLTFDPSSLPPGIYETLVSGKLDLISSITHFGADLEGLENRGTFTIVPEPTCALSLSLGVIAAIQMGRKLR